MRRKVCVVTGSRAEFGLLRLLMHQIRKSDCFELQVLATGMHLAPQFGSTYKEIQDEGFEIAQRVDMRLEGDSPTSVIKSMGIGLIGFADAFDALHPDLVVVLGDRFEIFAAAAAATVARIPIAHLHGGESTEGAIDEAFRHSTTKMAHLHFVAAEEYRSRVIQLGEHPDRVFTIGGLGIDNIKSMQLLGKEELEAQLAFRFGARSLLVTFHPATLDKRSAGTQVRELLAALGELNETNLVFTAPNADPEGGEIRELIEAFVATHGNAKLFASLGSLRYLSCLQYVDGVVGNSSSGLIEVPAFRKGSINIGDRQRGRLKASSVIDCEPSRADIAQAISHLYSDQFKASLVNVVNPYGDGGASEAIVGILERWDFGSLLKKEFYEFPAVAKNK
jgi:GDP/UDP-N,N'-diacetylbacillosamine 2-epimerase (hydrolysing)